MFPENKFSKMKFDPSLPVMELSGNDYRVNRGSVLMNAECLDCFHSDTPVDGHLNCLKWAFTLHPSRRDETIHFTR